MHIVAVFLIVPFIVSVAGSNSPATDKAALLSILDGFTSIGTSTIKENWTSATNPCSDNWTGVVCSEERVVYLNIGTDRFGFENLCGTLSTAVGNLDQLTQLKMNHQQLTGHLPSEVGKLLNLETLYTDGNHFTGPIPSEMGLLKKLTWMEMGFGNLHSGPIPPEVEALCGIINDNDGYIFLDCNAITAELPYTNCILNYDDDTCDSCPLGYYAAMFPPGQCALPQTRTVSPSAKPNSASASSVGAGLLFAAALTTVFLFEFI